VKKVLVKVVPITCATTAPPAAWKLASNMMSVKLINSLQLFCPSGAHELLPIVKRWSDLGKFGEARRVPPFTCMLPKRGGITREAEVRKVPPARSKVTPPRSVIPEAIFLELALARSFAMHDWSASVESFSPVASPP